MDLYVPHGLPKNPSHVPPWQRRFPKQVGAASGSLEPQRFGGNRL